MTLKSARRSIVWSPVNCVTLSLNSSPRQNTWSDHLNRSSTSSSSTFPSRPLLRVSSPQPPAPSLNLSIASPIKTDVPKSGSSASIPRCIISLSPPVPQNLKCWLSVTWKTHFYPNHKISYSTSQNVVRESKHF